MNIRQQVEINSSRPYISTAIRYRISAIASVGLLFTTAALADATSSLVSASTRKTGLEEIVVTTQRRSENLERTTVAVTVLSADTLERQNITTATDLHSNVAGFGIRSTLNSNQLNDAIGGESTGAFSCNRPGVLPYVNEVQVSGTGAAWAFYDLQSAQMQKGPQSTLFGRITTGGAVLFTAEKPTNEFGGYFSARIGNCDTRQVEGSRNIWIIGNAVLARIAGFYKMRKGYQYNLYTDSRSRGIERYGMRPTTTLKLPGEFTNTLMMDYYHDDGAGTAAVQFSLDGKIGAIPILSL